MTFNTNKISRKKFRPIYPPTSHSGRKSSNSISLAICGIALIPIAQGCIFAQHEALPQGELKYFSTTGAFGGQCVARELCNASYGLRECSRFSRYAIPAFDSREDCESAFKGTSLAVQCVDMEFGTPGVNECDTKKEQVSVELDDTTDEDGNPVAGTEDTELETMDCKKIAPAATLKKLYIPEAGHSFFNSSEMGSDTAGWFGGLQNAKTGRELQPFHPADEAKKQGFNEAAKISGYFVRGQVAPYSEKRAELLQSSLLSCPEVIANPQFKREVTGLLAVSKLEGSTPGAAPGTAPATGPGGTMQGPNSNNNSYGDYRHDYGRDSSGSFLGMFLLMQAFRPAVYSPWGGGYGYGFYGAPRYLTTGITGGTNIYNSTGPVYITKPGLDGKSVPLTAERVSAGLANKQAISNSTVGSRGGFGSVGNAGGSSKPTVKSSSIRSGGFGSGGRGGSSYQSGGSRSSFTGRGNGGNYGGGSGGSYGGGKGGGSSYGG